MIEQLEEVSNELWELKATLEDKQEKLFWRKVDMDPNYKKEVRLLNKDQEDEISGFMIEFSDILAWIKEKIFLEANADNEEIFIAKIKESLIWLEKEIANS